jgi:hypothetical protein
MSARDVGQAHQFWVERQASDDVRRHGQAD